MKLGLLAAALLAGAMGCQSGPPESARQIDVAVTEKGFEPSEIHVPKGESVVLAITRRTDRTCATEVVIDDGEERTPLPLDQTVRIDLGVVRSDRKFACGMDMIRGKVVAD
jgi:plastocyanin domain-containing protein